MADVDVVDLSPRFLPEEEERRRWAAEQAIKVVCASVSAQGAGSMATIDYALDRIANALDAYALDGTITRYEPART